MATHRKALKQLIIRQENPCEFQEIYNLVKVAFQTAKVADGNEQDYVNKLRASTAYIPQLAWVAEDEGTIVGHIMLTKTYVATDKSNYEALLVAPLCVTLTHRSRGVGSKLMQKSLDLARNMGYKTVFVVGDPAYYARFGFKSITLFNIRHNPPIPDPYVMVYELVPNALAGVFGTVNFMP